MTKTGLVVPFYNGSSYLGNWKLTDVILRNFDEVIFVDDCSKHSEFVKLKSFCDTVGFIVLRNEVNMGPLLSRFKGVAYLDERNVNYFMFMDCDDLLTSVQRPNNSNFDIITYGMQIRGLDKKLRYKTFKEGEYLAINEHPSMLGRWFKTEVIFPKLKSFTSAFGDLRFAEDLSFMLFISFFNLKSKTLSEIGFENIKRAGSLSQVESYDAFLTNKAILDVVAFTLSKVNKPLNFRYLVHLSTLRHSLVSEHKQFYLKLIVTLVKRGEMKNVVVLIHALFIRLTSMKNA